MSIKTQNHRIIFGLKVKQLRTGLKLSFAQLAEQSGLSVSYLNEIEKGKKYPRADKIALLAKALKIDVESLTSTELMKQLEGLLLEGRGSMQKVDELFENMENSKILGPLVIPKRDTLPASLGEEKW